MTPIPPFSTPAGPCVSTPAAPCVSTPAGPCVSTPAGPLEWSRAAPFGAWVRFGDGLLVAVDRRLAERLGVDLEATADGPLEVSIAITTQCRATCTGCYQEAAPAGTHVDAAVIFERIDDAARAGASLVAFGGGEPLLHPDVGRFAERARERGLVPVTTTSGLADVDLERLRAFAQINVSHDGVAGGYEAVRGFRGADVAERTMAALREGGIGVGWNLVLTAATADGLEASAARARELGCLELQLLRYKPSGRARDERYAERRLSREQAVGLGARLEALAVEHAGALSVRIDCSMIPLLAPTLLARGLDGAALSRAGIFGCEAGRHLGARAADGRAAPCSFFEQGELLSLGKRGSIGAFHAALPEPCESCALSSACRGGCQVVSRFSGGGFGPDPECLLLP